MSAIRLTALLSFGLILNQVSLFAFPAVLPTMMNEWGLNAAEAGWIGGIYFAGYAAAVPVLSGLTDRVDARRIYLLASLISAGASFAFAWAASGFWSALILRLVNGIGFAGVYMPGLKLLADRSEGAVQARCSAIYISMYALGSGGSFLLAGPLSAAFGWQSAFIAGGIGPLLAIAAVASVAPPQRVPGPSAGEFQFRVVLRDRQMMSWVACYAGNTWEVVGARTWFVTFVGFNLAQPGNGVAGLRPAILSGLSAVLSVPASIAIAESAVRFGRRIIVLIVTTSSILICGVLAAFADGPHAIVVALLFIHAVTSFGDTGAIAGGAVATANPRTRGAALAVYALCGFSTAFLGPVAIGQAIELAGGTGTKSAWVAAFCVMAMGSAVGALIMLGSPTAAALQSASDRWRRIRRKRD